MQRPLVAVVINKAAKEEVRWRILLENEVLTFIQEAAVCVLRETKSQVIILLHHVGNVPL